MSKRLFSSDWHLGHRAITKYRNQFSSVEEHDQAIFDQLSCLKKRDMVFVLGDFIFDNEKYDYYIETLSKMSCQFKLVLENHDSLKLYKETRIKNLELCLPLFSYKNHWISHCPIHTDELRGRVGNIHGHLHKANLNDDRYFDVGLDKNDFKFVPFENIEQTFKDRENKVYNTGGFLSKDLISPISWRGYEPTNYMELLKGLDLNKKFKEEYLCSFETDIVLNKGDLK